MIATLIKLLGLWFLTSVGWIPTPIASAPASLRDEIGQMLVLGFEATELKHANRILTTLQNNHIGGVLITFDDLDPQSIQALSVNHIRHTLEDLQKQTQRFSLQHHQAPLPLLITIDEEGGRIDRLRIFDPFEPTLPAAMYPVISQQKLTHELDKITTRLKATGFNLNLGPVLDVNVNPHAPIIGRLERSYSNDPTVVKKYASAFADALMQQGIQCTYKHFPGHGSAINDSHEQAVDVSSTWESYELFPYQQLLASHHPCQVVMTAHIINRQLDPSGLPATLSHRMLTQVLRQYLHFQGVIMSDDLLMKAILNHYSLQETVTLAINAGVDLLLFADLKKLPFSNPSQLIDLIEAQVQAGAIPRARIDEAYAHIVHLKINGVRLD